MKPTSERTEAPQSGAASALAATADHDAYAPARVAERVARAGVGKATLPLLPLFTLSLLAGAFIAFGAAFFLVATYDPALGYGLTRVVGGVAFSLGLVLVVVAGAELFTGNNLIVMALCDRLVTPAQVLRNWTVVYAGNAAGAAATAWMVSAAGVLGADDGGLARYAADIAAAKGRLPAGDAFLRGLLCNALVCLAVWLSYAAHSVSGKILAIVFPISAFVAVGFEHSVANMFFLPLGALAGADLGIAAAMSNLAVVTAGNVVGGSVFVGLVYWIVYRRDAPPTP